MLLDNAFAALAALQMICSPANDAKQQVRELHHLGCFDGIIELHGTVACWVLVGADRTGEEVRGGLSLATFGVWIAGTTTFDHYLT